MITLIHGEDTVASRKYYSELKSKYKDISVLAGDTVQLIDIRQIVEGGSLFADEITICIEDFFSKRKANSKEFKEIVDYLVANQQKATITFWENKEIPKATIAKLKGAENKLFSLPQDIFVFLDQVLQANPEKRVQLFHNALKQSEEEFVFYMLIRQVRILLALSDKNGNSIDEVKRLSPWQQNKFAKQLQSVPKENLLRLYKKLYEIDLAQKTGQLPMNLVQSLDFFLLGF